MPQRRIDLTGQRFGRYAVEGEAGRTKGGNYRWRCRCDCGSIAIVASGDLRRGNSRSCGCLQRELAAVARTTHGHTKGGESPEYKSWHTMKERCYNPNNTGYANYGGRGIGVCDRWRHSFDAFLADVGPRPSHRHSLDRINPNGPYSPSNVRWATQKEQQRNRRYHRRLTFRGRTMPLFAWADEIGISSATIARRIDVYDWTVKRALTETVHRHKSHPGPKVRRVRAS